MPVQIRCELRRDDTAFALVTKDTLNDRLLHRGLTRGPALGEDIGGVAHEQGDFLPAWPESEGLRRKAKLQTCQAMCQQRLSTGTLRT